MFDKVTIVLDKTIIYGGLIAIMSFLYDWREEYIELRTVVNAIKVDIKESKQDNKITRQHINELYFYKENKHWSDNEIN